MLSSRVTLAAAAALASVAAWSAGRVLTRHSLNGRTVVITGASTGIGRAVALLCVERGARVVLAARGEAALDAVARDVHRLGGEALVVPTDVTQRAQVQALVDAAVARFGRIDVMMNHAGDYFVDSVEHSEEARVRALIDVNVMGVLYGVQAVLPVMRRQGGGHIINTASVESRVAFPYSGVYAGTKAFVELMTQSLRQELMLIERTGIRVSAVLPAAVRTPLFDRGANVKAGGQGAHLIRPVQEPTQVAQAVLNAVEQYRPIIYPLRLAKGFPLLYDLLPGVADRVHSRMRVDAHTNAMSWRERGTNQQERPIPPVVRDGRLLH